jgi:hypothetical protein
MEQMEQCSSAVPVEVITAGQEEASQLFDELLKSEPAPTIGDLMSMARFKVIPAVKIVQAILAH